MPTHVRKRAWKRQERLRQLGFESYAAYLESPQWRKVRAEYQASELAQACMCGSIEIQLHHKTYDRVGEEHLDDLEPLCRDCHAIVHVLERRGDIELDLAGLYDPARAEPFVVPDSPETERKTMLRQTLGAITEQDKRKRNAAMRAAERRSKQPASPFRRVL